jgi:tetrathionate reductase subunit B
MHCENPTCVKACPTGATYKDKKDGTVKINPRLCINCGSCIPACPYGARFSHPEKKLVDKCNFCEERRERGEPVACVYVCPTKARTFGNTLDPESRVSQLLKNKKTVRVVNQKVDTKPNIFYVSGTKPLNWPVEPKDPVPIQLWKDIAGPIVRGLVGLTGLGVLAMLGKQILLKDDEPPDVKKETE